MTLRECTRQALRALQANRLRSALTMLGIVIGVAALITMMAIGSGAQQAIDRQIESLGANLLQITPGAQRSGATRMAAGSRHTLTEDDAAAIADDIPLVSVVAPAVQTDARLVHGNRNWISSVVGAVPGHLRAREWPVASGRLFTHEEVQSAAKVTLIGDTIARKLFGSHALGESVRIGNVPFTVIGILAKKGQSPFGNDQDDIAFVPLSTAKLRLVSGNRVNPGSVEFIFIKVREAELIQAAKQEIEALLRQRHGLRHGMADDFTVSDLAAMVSVRRDAGRTLTILLAAVATVSLVVGGISIMNIMIVSVTERTREIGLRLAVGARQRDVRNQFLIEAVVLCLLGGAAGLLGGIGISHLVARVVGWTVVVEGWSLLLAVGFSAMVGIFFGFYPALKASRSDPISALKFE